MENSDIALVAPRVFRSPGGLIRGLRRIWRAGACAPVVALVFLGGLQEWLSRSGMINASKFPPVSLVLSALGEEIRSARLWYPLSQTLTAWAIALSLSFVVAVVVGILIGLSGTVQALTAAIIAFLRPIPSTALIPLVILTLGANRNGAVFLTFFGAVWQMLPIVARGVGTVDAVAQDTARVFNFTQLQRLRWVTLPGMEPYLLTSLRVGAGTALVLLISMELLTGIAGVGRSISHTYAGSNITTMYAYVLVAGLLGTVVNLTLTRWSETRALGRGRGGK